MTGEKIEKFDLIHIGEDGKVHAALAALSMLDLEIDSSGDGPFSHSFTPKGLGISKFPDMGTLNISVVDNGDGTYTHVYSHVI